MLNACDRGSFAPNGGCSTAAVPVVHESFGNGCLCRFVAPNAIRNGNVNALAVLRSPATEPPLKRSHLQGSDCGNCGLGVEVNHDFHQTVLDLSPEFTARFPDAESSRSALPNYDLPYLLVPQSGRVLVVGAGTGNDVAAALRHGAAHVDAVEIAPLILGLGRKFRERYVKRILLAWGEV